MYSSAGRAGITSGSEKMPHCLFNYLLDSSLRRHSSLPFRDVGFVKEVLSISKNTSFFFL